MGYHLGRPGGAIRINRPDLSFEWVLPLSGDMGGARKFVADVPVRPVLFSASAVMAVVSSPEPAPVRAERLVGTGRAAGAVGATDCSE